MQEINHMGEAGEKGEGLSLRAALKDSKRKK